MTIFQDDNGNISSTRIKTFIAALVAFTIALYAAITKDTIDGNSLSMVFMLLAYSAGEKSYQKYLEIKKTKT